MVNRMSNRRNAFTLVELLVVVGIIALLIGLLFTSLGEFRRQAMQTACLSNERQIALASVAYANDSMGRLPSSRTDHIGSVGIPIYTNMWVDTEAPSPGPGEPPGRIGNKETLTSLKAGALWTYLGQIQPRTNRRRTLKTPPNAFAVTRSTHSLVAAVEVTPIAARTFGIFHTPNIQRRRLN